MNAKRLEAFRKAVNRVRLSIMNYRGEKIVAHKHPLHKSVVALEQLCVSRKPGASRQTHQLFYPADHYWYAILGVSRGTRDHLSVPGITFQEIESIWPFSRKIGEADRAAVAHRCANVLAAVLEGQVAVLETLAEDKAKRRKRVKATP